MKLRPVPCWEPVRGEKVLGAAPLAPGCARARHGPVEQRLQRRQPSCRTARSRWDHTPRFPSANLTIESSPLRQYLPSAGDKVATKVIGASISIHRAGGRGVAGQAGSPLSRRGPDRSAPRAPCPPSSPCTPPAAARRGARTPLDPCAAPLPAWDGCSCHGHCCQRQPAPGISTAPPPALTPTPAPVQPSPRSQHLPCKPQCSTKPPPQYCPIPAMSPQCPQPSLPGPACATQPALSLAPGCLCSLCSCPGAGEAGHDAEIQLLEKPRRSPERYQPGELIKVMSGDKETGCQSGGRAEPEKLPLKSNSTEM